MFGYLDVFVLAKARALKNKTRLPKYKEARSNSKMEKNQAPGWNFILLAWHLKSGCVKGRERVLSFDKEHKCAADRREL